MLAGGCKGTDGRRSESSAPSTTRVTVLTFGALTDAEKVWCTSSEGQAAVYRAMRSLGVPPLRRISRDDFPDDPPGSNAPYDFNVDSWLAAIHDVDDRRQLFPVLGLPQDKHDALFVLATIAPKLGEPLGVISFWTPDVTGRACRAAFQAR
jgi:hypothetical protein